MFRSGSQHFLGQRGLTEAMPVFVKVHATENTPLDNESDHESTVTPTSDFIPQYPESMAVSWCDVQLSLSDDADGLGDMVFEGAEWNAAFDNSMQTFNATTQCELMCDHSMQQARRCPPKKEWYDLGATGTQTPSKEDRDFDLAEVLGNASGSVQSCEVLGNDICSICLESTSRTPVLLACGHEFCYSCLSRHVELSLRDGLLPWCPLCRGNLLSVEVSALCQHAVDIPDPAHDILEMQAAPQSLWKRMRQQRAFKRTARKLHLKLCPGCGAMIQKTDGCNHMKCHCGRDFPWDEAETVVPCNKVHWNGWRLGKTCKNCTCSAHMKLAALRTGAALGAVPAAAVGAVAAVSGAAIVVAGAAVVTAVPAVVCTPLAIAYEPVRRLRGQEKNVFAKGISAGGSVVATAGFIGAWAFFGDGDDD